MLAFIGGRLSAARTDVIADYEVVRITTENRGVVRIDGAEQDFVIVTQPDQLRGLELTGFVFLPSSEILTDRQRVEFDMLMRSRVRLGKGQ